MAENGAADGCSIAKAKSSYPRKQANKDKMLSIVLDAGAEDLRDDGAAWEILTPPEAFEAVRTPLTKEGMTPKPPKSAGSPKLREKLTGNQAAQMLRLVEALRRTCDVSASPPLRYR